MRKNAQIGCRSANFAEWSNRTVVGAVHGCVHQASQFLRCSLLWTFLNHPPPAERLWSCYSNEHEKIKEMTVPVDINGRIKQHRITTKDWRHVNFYNDMCIKSSLYRLCQCQTLFKQNMSPSFSLTGSCQTPWQIITCPPSSHACSSFGISKGAEGETVTGANNSYRPVSGAGEIRANNSRQKRFGSAKFKMNSVCSDLFSVGKQVTLKKLVHKHMYITYNAHT